MGVMPSLHVPTLTCMGLKIGAFLFCRSYPIDEYPAQCKHAAAIMHNIMNNLDYKVAQVNLVFCFLHLSVHI